MTDHLSNWMLPKAAWVAIGLAFLAIVGCESRSPARPKLAALRPITPSTLDAAIVQHRGKVVLVDFWATTCGPCMQLLPHTLALQTQYGDRGLSVITVSLDGVEGEAAARGALDQRGAVTENYVTSVGNWEQSFEEFKIQGGIPFLKFYDRSGELREVAAGPEPDKIDQRVRQLLAEK